MIRSEVVKLTPELATYFLSNNRTNRPISKSTIERYVRAIYRGEWKLNGEPIIILEHGGLGDGQHRCIAVQKTGIAIDTVVIYGIDPKAFPTFDGGKPRNSADTLSIKGEVNTRVLSSAAREYLTCKLEGRDAYCITTVQIEKCIEDHPHLRYWAQKYCGARNMKLFPSYICGYLTIASERYGFEKMDLFFDQISTGKNLSDGDPALILRERFMNQSKVNRIGTSHIRAFMVKTINAHVQGKKLTFLRFVESETMPKII